MFICFCIDYENNNGKSKPYYMSPEFKETMQKLKQAKDGIFEFDKKEEVGQFIEETPSVVQQNENVNDNFSYPANTNNIPQPYLKMEYKCDFCCEELKKCNAILLKDVKHGIIDFSDILINLFRKINVTFGCIYCIEKIKSQYDFKQKVLSNQHSLHYEEQIVSHVDRFIKDSNDKITFKSYNDYLIIVKDSNIRLIELFEQSKRIFLPSIPLEIIDEEYSPPDIEVLLVPSIEIESNVEEEEDLITTALTSEELKFIDKNISKGNKCKICKKKGNNRPAIRYHIKREHLKKKWKRGKLEQWRRDKIREGKIAKNNYKCVICEFSPIFNSKESLREHLMQHTRHESFQRIFQEEMEDKNVLNDFSDFTFDHQFGFLIS
ncbi:hypothetical protein PVAND_003194 [Polypedilum vanderplanki]|uniref:C2H2-type domain-containing protein n=1 Tax=Polypedilum vanderplanki TaxID=319348 RepID=A0A9J6BTT0_POLVA|nr:hypothetical protein PVAND_003194 [Polypedilum vanderplanki]